MADLADGRDPADVQVWGRRGLAVGGEELVASLWAAGWVLERDTVVGGLAVDPLLG
jgi:hypothetical protein